MKSTLRVGKIIVANILISIAIVLIFGNNVRAEQLEPAYWFQLTQFHNTEEKIGYSLDDSGEHKIFNILKYNDNNGTPETNYEEGNYFCVKESVSITAEEKNKYTNYYDVNAGIEGSSIKSELISTSLPSSLNGIIVGEGGNYHYNYNILALCDLFYLDRDNNIDQIKAFEEKAGINTDEYTEFLTQDDLEAIQQAAIWYFTDGPTGEDSFEYPDPDDSSTILFYYNKNSNEYVAFSSANVGNQRASQAKEVYKYLINTAKSNSTEYSNNARELTNKVTLYTNATNIENTQPIILVEKGKEKEFDLALRKYITKIDGKSVETRVPNVDTQYLNTENNGSKVTTATYNHRKDPLEVKTDSVITYNISIYNEGEKSGWATEIIDQLPTGIKLKDGLNGTRIESTKGNNYQINYDSDNNMITFVLDEEENVTKLNPYKENEDIDTDTLSFECEVNASPDTKNKKVLTNIAWISKEYDAEDRITITNQEGKDRDSEPSTNPKINGNNPNKDNMSDYKGDENNKSVTPGDANYYYKGQQDDDDFEKVVLNPKAFDLKLLKRITSVNGTTVNNRITSVDISKLKDGTATTATYKMEKDPVSVKNGDIITYTFRIYNEGEIDGYASEITEDIPDGLAFLYSDLTTDEEIDADTSLSNEEKEAIKYNRNLSWAYSDSTLKKISTDYLAKGKGEEITTPNANLINAFDSNKEYKDTVNEKNPDYKEISVKLKVIAENTGGAIIRNEAAITKDSDSEGNDVDDRDSTPENWNKEDSNEYYDDNEKWPGYKEDDEDYDNIILQRFDLALRKFIIAVSPDTTIEESEYLKNADGTYKRAPIVDTRKLNTIEDGKKITTAIYNHPKTPVQVSKGDTVVYMLRVYNEGDADGYAGEITDYLPPYLEFVDGEFNSSYGWKLDEKDTTKRTVKTKYLENSLINAAVYRLEGVTPDGPIEGYQPYSLSYKEVPIMCKVKDIAKAGENITNIAEITEYKDENKQPINPDIDSTSDNMDDKLPSDSDLPKYKENETGEYVPGNEDDDDFEKIVIKRFDLALRKFITGVNDKEVTSRIPKLSYDSEKNKITYNHTKEPVEVVNSDTVIYTIRVYNEGEVNGFASEISDDLPEGLEFLPDNSINKDYRWVMFDSEGKETTEVSKAVKIKTDYLSKEQGEARMKKDNLKENPALLTAFDSTKGISDSNPDYADVKIAFKVIEPNKSDRVLVNSAQISDDTDEEGNPIEDIDSTPDKWIDGEDDQDQEFIKLTYFDLALRKWVTQAIVIENGKQTITETGHKAEDDPEGVVKVELHRKKLDSVVVKFRYSIRITNEGKIAGYAKEITDYVPEGLKFIAEDNPGWTDKGNNVITTRLLENTLLQPGESAEVTVLLTWINNGENLGLKTNIAEISEDYNDRGVPDIDSTPGNKVPGEDDIDDAPVLLSISTGKIKTYATLGLIILVTVGSGIVLIKKFVL